jgi:pleckstrin domain-containing family G protein 5
MILLWPLWQNPQQNQLCELLNTYTKNGVPKSKSSYINAEYSEEALGELYDLPASWRDFVNACDISEIDTKIQSAIWELVTTEVDYIHAIQTVTDVSAHKISLQIDSEHKSICAKVLFLRKQTLI